MVWDIPFLFCGCTRGRWFTESGPLRLAMVRSSGFRDISATSDNGQICLRRLLPSYFGTRDKSGWRRDGARRTRVYVLVSSYHCAVDAGSTRFRSALLAAKSFSLALIARL